MASIFGDESADEPRGRHDALARLEGVRTTRVKPAARGRIERAGYGFGIKTFGRFLDLVTPRFRLRKVAEGPFVHKRKMRIIERVLDQT